MIESNVIDRYFERYGGQAERLNSETWRTTLRGEIALYPLYLHLTPRFVYLHIAPFLLEPKEEAAPRLFWALLRYNQEMDLAKFSMDANGDILLSVELPAEDFDYTRFEEALSLLERYADAAYRELLNLAQDPDAECRFDDEENPGLLA